MLHIAILGLLQVRSDDTLCAVSAPQLISLLGYLALHGADGRPIAREGVMEALYPELPPAQARRALSDTIYRLRGALGDGAESLVSGERAVALRDVWVDVVAFRRLVATGSLETGLAALELYRGDLLEQIDDDWALGQRAVLRELVLATLAQVCAQLVVQGRLADGLLYAHRWVESDPFNETAHRALMRIYAQLGRRDAALLHYQQLTEMLDRELQATPLPETRAVGEALRAPRQRARPSPEDELQRRLRELTDDERGRLELLALLGAAWSPALLQQVLAADLDTLLAPLVQRGLIVVNPEVYAFAQVELRDLVLADLVSECLHRPLSQIVAALQRMVQRAPPPIQVRLAPGASRHGRAGYKGGRILVSWTLDAGEGDRQILEAEGKVALRRHRIVRLLEEARAQGAAPTVQDLAQALAVSARSVEADLAALRKSGALREGGSGPAERGEGGK